MIATVDDLLLIIGRQQVELEMLRRQVMQGQALLETRAATENQARRDLETKQIQAQIDGKEALKEVAEKQIERLERRT